MHWQGSKWRHQLEERCKLWWKWRVHGRRRSWHLRWNLVMKLVRFLFITDFYRAVGIVTIRRAYRWRGRRKRSAVVIVLAIIIHEIEKHEIVWLVRVVWLLMLVTLLLLLLKKTMDLEPIRTATVSWSILWHSHNQALLKSACLTSCSVLLVDYALTIVLAFRYRC